MRKAYISRMAEQPKYKFYEKVLVTSNEATLQDISGETGAVLGISQSSGGEWGYAVHIYRDKEVWDIMEEHLEPTGEMDCRETFYDGASMRVSNNGDVLDDTDA